MLKELATYIQTETDLVIGEDLFGGFLPAAESQADAVALIRSGGTGTGFLPDLEEVALQVISRAQDYWDAESKAWTVCDLLHGMAGVTLPVVDGGETYIVNTAEAVVFPQSLGQDDRNNFVISTNFTLRIQTG